MNRIMTPFPAISIEDFMSPAIVRAAAESFNDVSDDDWVKYGVKIFHRLHLLFWII